MSVRHDRVPDVRRRGHCRWRKDIQIKLLIEHSQVSLRTGSRQFCRHRRQNTVISTGMVTQGVAQRQRHQTGIAILLQRMIQASQQTIARGKLRGQPGADMAAQRNQNLLAELLCLVPIPGQHNTQQGL